MKLKGVAKSHPDWTTDATCKSCGSLQEICKADIFVKGQWDITGKHDDICFVCGGCGKENIVEKIYDENRKGKPFGDLPSKEDFLKNKNDATKELESLQFSKKQIAVVRKVLTELSYGDAGVFFEKLKQYAQLEEE